MQREVFFSLNHCNLAFGKKVIFDDASLSIHNNDNIAIVGKNGVGKSTLFNIISQSLPIDSGELWTNPKIKIGYLNQRENFNQEVGILEYLDQFTNNKENDQFIVKRLCEGLKINPFDKLNQLSGGMKRKLNLASVIITNPDLILLDEPTNHLDLESINWLEIFLKEEFRGSFLVISHNRSFLKNITNKVFWIDRTGIKISPKGFSDFENWSQNLIGQEKREIENKKKILTQEMEWLSKGVTARRKRNVRRKSEIFTFKEDFEKQRSEFLKSISKVKISYDEEEQSGTNLLINFHNVKKKFLMENDEKVILKNFNFKLMKGEKIGIIGKNGSGKSTFLNLIKDKNIIDEGNIKIRKNLGISYFDQSGEQFNDNKTIKENMIPGGGDYLFVGDKKCHICGYLKNFLFDPKKINFEVGVLSGGERNRLLLAKILAKPREILILDEPTNDLDIETIDILIEFLNKFNGGVFVVSHDKDFLEKVVNKIIFLDGLGNHKVFNEWPQNLFDNKNEQDVKEKKDKSLNIKKEKEENAEKKINRILKKIEKKELMLNELTLKLKNFNQKFDLNSDDYQSLIKSINTIQNEISSLENEWFEIEEKSLEQIKSEHNET